MKSLAVLSFAGAALSAAVGSFHTNKSPEIVTLPSKFRADGVVKKIRYGPLSVDAATRTESGELVSSKFDDMIYGLAKPCDECYLQAITAHLEYANGTQAANPGTYLHHIVVVNAGDGVTDGTCGGPGFDPFFSSGNEQPSEIYTDLKMTLKTGYHLTPKSMLVMNAFFLNNEPVDKDIYVSLEYEIVDGKKDDFAKTKVAWIAYGHTDCKKPITNAEAADVVVPNEKAFTLTSDPWVSPWSGDIIITGGHLHNGGVAAKIYLNDKLICDSRASYTPGTGMAMMGERRLARRDGSEFLSKMSSCEKPGPIKKGDKVHLVVDYDFVTHPGMKKVDGHIAPVMALAKFYIASN